MESLIGAYIIRELVSEPQSITLENDTPLLESRILDSQSLLKLSLFLEKRFVITVEEQEMVAENFATINAICRFVSSKMVASQRLGTPGRRAVLWVDRVFDRFILPVVAFLPAPLAYGVALLRSDLGYRLLGGKKSFAGQEIAYSLELLFGDRLTPRERDRAARDYFRMRSCEKVDSVRLLGRGKALLGLVEVRGQEHLREALAGGRGAILCSAHFGSTWCCFSLIGALGFPITVVARWSWAPSDGRNRNMLSESFFHFERYHLPVISHLRRPNIERNPGRYGTAVQSASVLKQNEFVGMLLDADVRPDDPSKPMVFDFLNGKAILVPGATTIAHLTGAPVMVLLLRRSADWRHQVLEISPPIPVGDDPVIAFRRCLAPVEAAIRRYPAQWYKLPVADRRVEQVSA